ncbi:MAG: acyl-CoA dehydrogenase family protein [Gammaproteobacteria bacterium]
MDFQLSFEQQMILDYGENLAQNFGADYWREKSLAQEFPLQLWQQIAADGFLGVMVSEQYGGAGLGMTEMALLMEGLSAAGLPLFMMVVGPTMTLSLIDHYGSEPLKQRYLPDGCSGEKVFCFAITEPNAGSNSMAITTLAKADGAGFKLNGQKAYITGADAADYALVVARTTPLKEAASKTDGFTLFMVDLKAPGVTIQAMDIPVMIPEKQCEVFFDNVELGPDQVVGEVDRGFAILFDVLNPERIVVAAMAVGLGRYALKQAVEYAGDRKVFGAPIGSHQGLAHPLAHAYTEIEMSALMTYKAAGNFDQGAPAGAEANMAKYYAAEAAINAVDKALQVNGGAGFTRDVGLLDLYSLVRLLRTIPVSRELLLNYIGEKVMGLPRSY